ncbi:AAA family ATPase [Vibrio nigripulchritudo]|uniref:AAA family ATPase n=1 Tax=Vibrio nigripulchritudo TaxID=28173 RepID=UPI00248FB043|nr:ATP-binding protein [Vibrio nigripulchritudo]BDU36770.1 hypothetical protein TUMSATVNIG2_12390 [Vibrio nigripulchritudo]BDU42480.1 hypothetical protein TUMSATVNIG3_12780 [Vibrio nigripulchritudo]
MAKVFLIEGPVGAGKSTFSKDLSKRMSAPHINLDSWMSRLFSPDRPSTNIFEWYVARKKRCNEQIWEVALSILNSGSDVILELGLIQSDSRKSMYDLINESGHKVSVYVLDAPKEQRRKRVQYRNISEGSTFSMEVSDEVFELASNMWEEPNEIECTKQEVIFVPQSDVDQAFQRTRR